MKHNREKDRSKVLLRKSVWDRFHWGYYSQFGRLWKNHWLKDGCAICHAMQYEKYHAHKVQRRFDKKEIEKQLAELE